MAETQYGQGSMMQLGIPMGANRQSMSLIGGTNDLKPP